MIIKSMSRKVPSFGQLLGYIDRDEGQEPYRIRHNLLSRDPARIRDEFERNGDLLQRRRNGVYLYHEIISITRAKGISAEAQKERLYEIAQAYIAARCGDNLVFGGLHQDKEHSYHYHLMISANRAGETGRLRLSKAQFRQIQVGLENHVLEKFPELEQKVAIGKRAERKISRSESELERRTGARPKRDEVLERVREAFGKSNDRDSLLEALGRHDLELYVRGKTVGVIDHESGKRHRLKTLDAELADRVEGRMMEGFEAQGKTASEGEKEKGADTQREHKSQRHQEPKQTAEETVQTQPEHKSDKEDYVKRDSNADLNREPVSQQKGPKEQDMEKRREDPQTGTQYRDPEIPDAVYETAERASAGETINPVKKIAKFAKKAFRQGAEETRHAGDLLRRGLTGDHEPSKDQEHVVDNPAMQAGPSSPGVEKPTSRSAQQEKWRSEIKQSRETGRDDPERGRD